MENSTETTFIDLIVAGMFLAFALSTAIVIFVMMYQRKLSKERSKLQELKIEHQTALIHAAIRAVEDERKQFAANLHDEIGAHLSIAKMTLGDREGSEILHDPHIEKAIEILDAAVTSIHEISHNLLPPVLLKLGLAKAIETALRKLPDGIQIVLEIDPHLDRFDPDVELHAYRIFQEAISNAIKHGQCTSIQVKLGRFKELFELKITDNGSGFDAKNSFGLGLLNMQSRAEIIGGQLTIDNTTEGVSVQFVPIKNRMR